MADGGELPNYGDYENSIMPTLQATGRRERDQEGSPAHQECNGEVGEVGGSSRQPESKIMSARERRREPSFSDERRLPGKRSLART